MNNFYINVVSNEEARKMIIDNHYTHKWTIAELCLGIYDKTITHEYFDMCKLLGVIVFGPTAGANVGKSLSDILKHNELWELKRLWTNDCLPKNTESWFIAKSIDYIKKNHKNIKCLISYADPDAGHIGTIYQATNWIYQNIERPKGTSGYVVSFDGGKKWEHARTLFNKYGTFNYDKLIEKLPRPFLIKELSVKERYVYPLGNKIEKKKLIENFNYESLPYPRLKNEKEKIIEFK
jgi:hypothetical protein